MPMIIGDDEGGNAVLAKPGSGGSKSLGNKKVSNNNGGGSGHHHSTAKPTPKPKPQPKPLPKYTGRASDYGIPMGTTGTPALRSQTATLGLTPQTYQAYQELMAYMKARNMAVRASDTWRSYAAQQELYRRKPGLATYPGNSVHGTGRAFDLEDASGRPLSYAQDRALQQYAGTVGLWNPVHEKENWHYQLRPEFDRFGRNPSRQIIF